MPVAFSRKNGRPPRDGLPRHYIIIGRGSTIAASLVDRDGFGRANVDAGAAIAAHVFINDGLAVFDFDGIQRTRINALFTTGALFGINLSCHSLLSQKTNVTKVSIPKEQKSWAMVGAACRAGRRARFATARQAYPIYTTGVTTLDYAPK
jgi:hypothetical protein